MEQEKLQVQINDKIISLDGSFEENIFCVAETSIEKHPSLSPKEKESLKKELKRNKNIKLGI